MRRFAIEDMNVPREAEAEEYEELSRDIVDRMRDGQNVVVHCRGGLGCTSTVAACVLAALGDHRADETIDAVRAARKGTVQERSGGLRAPLRGDPPRTRRWKPVNVEDMHSLPPKEERRAGAILGLTVGDALGATY